MCDTLCALDPHGTLFAKSSDRPPGEAQVIEALPRRSAGGRLRTQYLELDDPGAAAILGSRPSWLWGLEHGVNEHGVAIGNERVWTIDDPEEADPALIGMDLVRLGLERGRSAAEALEVVTGLLETHGQGGAADPHGQAYFSSFLLADPAGAWVLETSGRTWVARPEHRAAAISNRLTLGRDWTRASADVERSSDWDSWRLAWFPTGHADVRLAASRTCLSAETVTPARLAAHLRDHGQGPWGEPEDDSTAVSLLPPDEPVDGSFATVCMHLREYQVTTSAMVAQLPGQPGRPLRAWVCVGSPCAGVFVPVFPPDDLPAELARESTWQRFAALRRALEAGPLALADVRAVLGPVESELWAEAWATDRCPPGAWARIDSALTALGA